MVRGATRAATGSFGAPDSTWSWARPHEIPIKLRLDTPPIVAAALGRFACGLPSCAAQSTCLHGSGSGRRRPCRGACRVRPFGSWRRRGARVEPGFAPGRSLERQAGRGTEPGVNSRSRPSLGALPHPLPFGGQPPARSASEAHPLYYPMTRSCAPARTGSPNGTARAKRFIRLAI
jgi:hypothetical protein